MTDPEITPEQRAALSAILDPLISTVLRAGAQGSVEDRAFAITAAKWRAMEALAGFRAPGPPTEAEVERAARVKAGPGSRWESLPAVVRGLFRVEAREELTAALGGKPDAL